MNIALLILSGIFLLITFLFLIKHNRSRTRNLPNAAYRMMSAAFLSLMTSFCLFFIGVHQILPEEHPITIKYDYAIDLKQDTSGIFYIIESEFNDIDTVSYTDLEDFFLEDNL
jgi:hypothetical protein